MPYLVRSSLAIIAFLFHLQFVFWVLENRDRRAPRPAPGFPISHRYHTTSINVKSRLYYAEYLQLSPFSFQHSASSPRPDRSFCLLLCFLPLFPLFSILTFVIRIGNLCYFRLFLVIMHKSSSELEKRRYLLENDEKSSLLLKIGMIILYSLKVGPFWIFPGKCPLFPSERTKIYIFRF